MSCQVLNSALKLLLLLSAFDVTPASALAPRSGASYFLTRKIRQRLEHRVFTSAEKQRFVPVHGDIAAIQTESCTAAPKTGFWLVGCYVDKDPDSLRQQYEPEDKFAKMTPEICFNFCKYHKKMRYFFLSRGKDCSCARYYHKGSTGGLGGCTLPCTGDSSKYCGGENKESVYEMHDCNAAAYVPTDPNEGFDLATELTDNGVKFTFMGRDMGVRGDAGNGTEVASVLGGPKSGLIVLVVDPHNGMERASQAFLIDGWNGEANKQGHDVLVAHAEAARMRTWVNSKSLLNDVVMVGSDPRGFNEPTLIWGSDVEAALIQLGCPQWQKPNKGMGYAAICSGHSDGRPASETVVAGHVSGYGPVGTSVETSSFYMIDCEVSPWKSYGDCSLTCGGGLIAQDRHVTIEPAHGGQICPEAYDRFVPCNEDPCPIDCGYSEWTPWGTCSHSCGPGDHQRTRAILNQADYGGVECNENVDNLLEEQGCQIVPCPIHAEWANWGEWSECSEWCGDGEETRERVRAVEAKYGGDDVEGPFTEVRGCFIKHCPVDCEVSDWEDEGDCTLTCGGGEQKQTREITTAVAHGGAECPSDLEQFLPCNENPCPLDCSMSDWEDDGGCSLTCGGGKQYQYRYVKVTPQHGGVRCPRSVDKVIDCNIDRCPIDCHLSTWSGWSPCDKTCGPGTSTRTRMEERVAQFGGAVCVGALEESMDCQVVPCRVDCEWGGWTEWGNCNQQCGPGRQQRTRVIEVHAQWGGNPCEGLNMEEQDCELQSCPVDCEVSDWELEGSCDRACGGGQQLQVRRIMSDAAHGGECPTDMTRYVECNTHACPTECEMSNWADDGGCSLTCGGGIQQQKRQVLTSAANGAEPCPTDMDREIGCNDQPCPIDGVWGPWSGWSACSTYCGPGTSTRTRRVHTPAAWGGVPCSGQFTEDKACQARECPIDCEWGEWGGWGACSDTCGPGVQYRNRDIAVHSMHGGNGCQGFGQEEQECQDVPCPIECEVTQWQIDGDCSLSCGYGLQGYTREVTVEAAHGGAACPSDLFKQEPCNTQSCPVDCEVSDWVQEGECSESCGGGVVLEVKNILTAPAYGGEMCPTQMQRHVTCGEDPCPIDCMYDAWSGWSMCSSSCGNGTESRTRGEFQSAMHGGAPCVGDAEQNRDCEIVPCPIDCVWGDWGSFSACSEQCGPGDRERSRAITVHNMYGGASCEGPEMESESCEVAPCPVECEVSEWGAITECDKACGTGSLTEERTIIVNAEHGAEACPSDLTRTVACNTDPCPVDCVLGQWTATGTCSQECGGGVVKHVRSVLVQAEHNGRSCHPEQEKWVACNEEPCPIDGVWSPWTGWSKCSAYCGDGTSERTRVKEVIAAHGGEPCAGESREEQGCTAAPCPIDGVWDDWSDWGECDEQCGEGRHIRQRVAQTYPAYGGKLLDGPSAESKTCKIKECPVDCEVGPWKTKGACSATCGGGTFTQEREITTAAAHDGEACPADLTKELPCNENPCPVDCVLSDFAQVTQCSAVCGGGTYKEQRTVETPQAHNGNPCDAPLERDIDCNTEPCAVDCVWGQWSGFGLCSLTCGEGAQERTRGIEIEAAHGGIECEGEESESRACELSSCPIDGAWGDWTDWTVCDEQCGVGETRRTRPILTPAQFGGAHPDGAFEEVEECEIEPCPVDCVISEWEEDTQCTVSCGGGTYTEKREVQVNDQFGGEPCPTDLMRTLDCNPDPCPVDCVLSDWFEATSCSVTCGGGSRTESRVVQVSPAFGGAECNSTRSKELVCGEDPCPVNCEFEEWAGWSECSKTCGNGQRDRSRGEAVSAAHGGEACNGAYDESEACFEVECPIDCELSEWGDWGICSEACGPGTHSRSRFEDPSAAYGGAACNGALQDSQDCEVVPCPVDCVMGDWVDEGYCSQSCGGGYQQQYRDVTTAAAHGGVVCPAVEGNVAFLQDGHGRTQAHQEGRQSRQIMCNTHVCPIDCELTAMTVDVSCSKSCGGGIEIHRAGINVAAAHGGVECPAEDSEQRYKEEACNEDACPVDCVVSQWTGWGACSESCGEGESKRTRDITTDVAHGGVACPEGMEESQTCHIVACPIDCVVGQWSNWADCSSDCGPGSRDRARTISTEAQYGGVACEDALQEAEDCEITPCPIDCELDSWVDDDAGCSTTCGGGELKQTRGIKTAAEHGGEECTAATEQTVICNEDPCPVDCVLSDWTESTSCSVTCGGGDMTFIKSVESQAAHGGAACPEAGSAEMSKTETCGEEACPVDCVLSAWGAWSECSASCGDGTRTKTRTVETEAANGGVACEGEMSMEESCKIIECPIDCVMDDWSEWSDCSATCLSAGVSTTQSRTRNATTEPEHGGAACDEFFENRTECPGLLPCPIDCVLGAWEAADCSVTCGEGTYKETRPIETEPQHNGTACSATERELPCSMEVCPVDCETTEPEAIGTCSRACGGGVQVKRRYITVAAVGTGAACPAEADLETEEECNTHECPGESIGETGAALMPMDGAGGVKTITLNVAHHAMPVFIAGPLPGRGDDRVGLAVVEGIALQEAEIEMPLDEQPSNKTDECKCTGGPSNAVPMGDGNVQYPASYGDYCHAWTPRDPYAAEASADGPAELTYLGDGWAYNSATKMRVYVGNDIIEADQTLGETVVFPAGSGAKIPDFPAEGDAAFPSDGGQWCYVSADCLGHKSDGWAEWVYCGEGGPGWDDQPAPGYPDVTVCPLADYDGATPAFTVLTTKYDASSGDRCVGKMDHNSCHDPSSFGGMTVGLVSSINMDGNMKMLKRAYHSTSKDTCLYIGDQKDEFCPPVGDVAYPDGTDLGYVFASGSQVPGTLKLNAYIDTEGGHTCVGGDEDSSCDQYDSPSKEGFAYLMAEDAWDAWSTCGAQATTDLKWQVTLETKLEGSRAADAPNYEKVAWMALKQGVFKTSSNAILQAGIAMIPADGEFHEIVFHQDFGSAPTVITQQVAPVDFVRAREAEAGKFWASADAGFEELELTGNCVDKVTPSGVSTCTPKTTRAECQSGGDCAWNEIVVGKCRADNVLNYGACKAHMNDEAGCTGAEGCTWSTDDTAHHGPPSVAVHWIAIDATDGYLASYPFVAGTEEMTSDETELAFENDFTQVPLVFGSVATDRTVGEADIRVVANAANSTTLILQGASTAEKASYLIYNGKGSAGSVFKATPELIMNYSYHVGGWGECEAASSSQGVKTRTVECKGSNGKVYATPFCTGAMPHAEENCQVSFFYMLHTESGRCLVPESTTATEDSESELSTAVALSSCTSEAGKLRMLASDEGFKVANLQTGRCLCKSSSYWKFESDCSQSACSVTRTVGVDGSFTISPVGSTYCLRGITSSGSIKFYSSSYCSRAESQWSFITAQVKMASYSTEPAPNVGTAWYLDRGGVMLMDGEVMQNSWGDSNTCKGVGWYDDFTVTVTPGTSAPVQAVKIGYDVYKDWEAEPPSSIAVSCDGGSPISVTDFEDDRYHNEVTVNVGSVCGADDVDEITIAVKPKPSTSQTKYKTILDEISIFNTADFGDDTVGSALMAKEHHVKRVHHVHKHHKLAEHAVANHLSTKAAKSKKARKSKQTKPAKKPAAKPVAKKAKLEAKKPPAHKKRTVHLKSSRK